MGLLAANAGASSAVGPTSGGKVYPYNNISQTPQVVIQPNPNRTTLTFHNPGASAIYVAPVLVQGNGLVAPTTPTNQPLTPNSGALGGCFLINAGGGYLTLSGECSGAYQAFAALGATNPLTVTESNV